MTPNRNIFYKLNLALLEDISFSDYVYLIADDRGNLVGFYGSEQAHFSFIDEQGEREKAQFCLIRNLNRVFGGKIVRHSAMFYRLPFFTVRIQFFFNSGPGFEPQCFSVYAILNHLNDLASPMADPLRHPNSTISRLTAAFMKTIEELAPSSPFVSRISRFNLLGVEVDLALETSQDLLLKCTIPAHQHEQPSRILENASNVFYGQTSAVSHIHSSDFGQISIAYPEPANDTRQQNTMFFDLEKGGQIGFGQKILVFAYGPTGNTQTSLASTSPVNANTPFRLTATTLTQRINLPVSSQVSTLSDVKVCLNGQVLSATEKVLSEP